MKINDIEELMKMWKEDSVINNDDLKDAVLKNSSLHSKYLNIMTTHSLILEKIQVEEKKRRRVLTEYFSKSGMKTKKELDENGFDHQFEGTVLKSDIPMYIDAEEKMIEILLRKAIHTQIVKFCEYVIKCLHNRSFEVRSAITYEMFENGK